MLPFLAIIPFLLPLTATAAAHNPHPRRAVPTPPGAWCTDTHLPLESEYLLSARQFCTQWWDADLNSRRFVNRQEPLVSHAELNAFDGGPKLKWVWKISLVEDNWLHEWQGVNITKQHCLDKMLGLITDSGKLGRDYCVVGDGSETVLFKGGEYRADGWPLGLRGGDILFESRKMLGT